MITAQELLQELFDYNPETGWFINRCDRGPGAYKGYRAGSPSGHGYRKINVRYEKYYEHHLAWLYVYGEWPGELDHKDGNRSNNAISNLRKATRTQNCFNKPSNTGISGLRGAYWNHRTSSWFSRIQVGRRIVWLGTYSTPEQAHAAYLEAADVYAGEFAFHNRKLNPS